MTNSDSYSEEEGDQLLKNMFKSATNSEIYIDEIMVSAKHYDKPKGTNSAHLSKIWHIDLKASYQTLDVTTKEIKCTTNPILLHHYGSNDQMLHCKRIQEYFFMDTFFAAKKSGKSSRGTVP